MKKNTKLITLFNLGSALVLLAVVFMMYTPFWSTPEGELSICDILWFPHEHNGFGKFYEGALNQDFVINDVVTLPVIVFVLSALGVVFTAVSFLQKKDSTLASILAIPAGVFGILGYLTSELFLMGNLWFVHIGLYAAAIVLGVITLVLKAVHVVHSC